MSKEKDVKLTLLRARTDTHVDLPLAGSGVSAGFPSPADDFIEGSIDLNKLLIRDPSATFFARVAGDSMRDDGIYDGNLLVVEKKLQPEDGDIVVSYLNGEFTLKRLEHKDGKYFLIPSNPKYHPIEVSPDDELIVWGSVRASINLF